MASQETLDSETIQAIQQVVSENESNFDDLSYISKYFMDKKSLRKIRKSLKAKGIARREVKTILNMVREEISLSNKIRRLQTMQNLFKYWHVAHLPFALIMLIILVVHVGVTVAFGYKWMF